MNVIPRTSFRNTAVSVERGLDVTEEQSNLLNKSADIIPAPVQSNLFVVGVGILKSIITGGIFGIPILFHLIGFAPVSIILLVSAFLTYNAMKLLSFISIYTHQKTYADVTRHVLSYRTARIVQATIALDAWALIFIYIILIRDSIPSVINYYADIDHWPWKLEGWMVLVITVMFVFPLSSPNHVAIYRFTGYYSIIFFSTLIAFIAYELFENGIFTTNTTSPIAVFEFNLSWFTALSVLALAFSAQLSLIRLIADVNLHENNEKRDKDLKGVYRMVLLVVFIIYYSFGSGIYLRFGPETTSNAISAYDQGNILAQLIRIMIGIEALTSIPIMVFVSRDIWFNVWEIKNPSPKLRIITTFFMVVFSAVIAVVVPDLLSGLAFVGALLGSPNAFILPGFLFLAWETNIPKPKFKIYMSYILITIGCLITVIALVVEILNLTNPSLVSRRN